MKGEPTPTAAKESRLQATTCDEIGKEEIEQRIKAMRAAVDRSFKDWHDGQPECWRQDRENYLARKEVEKALASGLGLSGIGEGGGGIGLGSIGTLGRGAGAGIGYGYGSGSGRTPSIRMAQTTMGRAAPAKAASASGTNNQVASVDEADIVKTDGRYVYLASNGALRIVEAMNPRVVSVTKVQGTARELFVEGDRAILYASSGNAPRRCTYGYDCTFGGDGSTTKIIVFDVTDRSAPKVVREIDATGSLIAARRIGNTIHTVVADGDSPTPAFPTWPGDLRMCGTEESKVRARFAKLKADNEAKLRQNPLHIPTLKEHGAEQKMCARLMRTAFRDGQAFTSVVSFDLTNDTAAPTTATVQSRPGAVFASDTGLYLSVIHRKQQTNGRWYSYYPSVDEVSEIHKFAVGSTPSATKYVGSGTVPGHVLNQFAMDEWNGYLRIATTRGKVPDPKVSSVVSILAEVDGSLVRVGAIENIAPGEDIRAVRFDDDRGYVVTFKKTDPLFVMDLYDVQTPRVLGELKIPGFSTYIHRIDPEHLLSIGFDADDKGSFAYFDGVILQLFDVKNPTDPRLVHKEKIGTRGSSSEAATN
ncbi:MAG TPA: beta-propeller domain-containing protein, partial [Labilithrix sp.]|nr:beta-propeller domain-containing protein [Labilithrix sp.]